MGTETITTLPELKEVATKLLAFLATVPSDKAVVLALLGDLGVGKTALVQCLARQLGVTETVTSPTFVVMKQYETESDLFLNLIHIDAYRIETEDELGPLGFSELLNQPQTLICIEWAKRIEMALPSDAVTITLKLLPDGLRTLMTTYNE
jgi:tRNA threonylcarbamoyladenosine biosynthesis protein TsaE